GQVTSASASASCARSSAVGRSPVRRASAPTMRADSIRHTASTARRPGFSVTTSTPSAARRGSELTRGLAPRALALDPLVVLRELVDARDAADLGLHAGPGHRDPPRPLRRLLDRCDVEDPEAA